MNLEETLKQIDELKNSIVQLEVSEEEKSFRQDFNLRYTYESNAIEGNTLTLMETRVVLEGLAIGGKSLREHFEVINHHNAIEFIEGLAKEK